MTRLRAVASLGALVLVMHLAPRTGARVQATDPARLIRVNAIVQNPQGEVVLGLRRDDFEILIDGAPVAIYASSSGAPLSVVVLLDITASMEPCPDRVAGSPSSAARPVPGTRLPARIPPAVAPFQIAGFRPGDRIQVGAVGRRVILADGFSRDAAELSSQWQTVFNTPPIEWLGPSPIWDAVAEATTSVSDEPGQRAVVLISDGAATGNVRGLREVSDAAARAGVSVSVVAEESVVPWPVPDIGVAKIDSLTGLLALADMTGGVAVVDKAVPASAPPHCTKRNPTMAFRSVLDRLHHVYALDILPPSADDRRHDVAVRVKKPDMRVIARKAYAVPSRDSP